MRSAFASNCMQFSSLAVVHTAVSVTSYWCFADVVQIVKAKIKHGDEGRGRFSTVKKDNKDKKPLKS